MGEHRREQAYWLLALMLIQASDELFARGASGHFQNLPRIDKRSL